MKYKRAAVSLAQSIWKGVLSYGDTAIDATCGRGHDSAFLASLILTGQSAGWLHCCDIQSEAIADTKELLEQQGYKDRVSYHLGSHESFKVLGITESSSIKCIVYNLGYLPKGNKKIITCPLSTLLSLRNAECLLQPGGMLSITAYRGHLGGKEEYDAVSKFMESLNTAQWTTNKYFTGQSETAPVLFTAQKKISE